MRYYCTVDGLTDSWIELADAWTRAEWAALQGVKGNADYFDILRRKTTAMHLATADGGAINDVALLTDDGLQAIDLALWGFLVTVLFRAAADRKTLGDFAMRALLSSSDKTS